MNKRDMKKEIWWAVLANVFSETIASDAMVRDHIKYLQPNGFMTEATTRRYDAVLMEVIHEIEIKAGL